MTKLLTEIKLFLTEYFYNIGASNQEVIIQDESEKLIVTLIKNNSDSIWNDRVKDKTDIEISVDQETWVELKSSIYLYKKKDKGKYYPIVCSGNKQWDLKRLEIDTRWEGLNPLIVIGDIFTNLSINKQQREQHGNQ